MNKPMLAALPLLALLACPLGASAEVPQTLQVVGVLTATGGGAAADGEYVMTFSLYDTPQGGTAKWSEGGAKVQVAGGRFAHTLGATKPLTDAVLASMKAAWLGLEIGANPELPRVQMHSVAWALQARALACSGCVTGKQIGPGVISADKIGFTYAGAKTKGGPANLAMGLQCTGCVNVDQMKFDKDLDLGGNALKAKSLTATDITGKTVAAQVFIGDGSKLTGIKSPAGQCAKKGEVVKGIAADGSLVCVAAMDPSGLPPDGLDEISNGLLTNQYLDTTASSGTPVPISDNNPTGVSDTLVFPDIGVAQELTVQIHITNSDTKTLEVILFDPANVQYQLYNKGAAGKVLKTAYPTPTKTLTGDLTKWVGKNPKGIWRLKVVDTGFLNNGKDGNIESWSVSIKTLSTKKVTSKGLLITEGGLQLGNADAHPVTCGPALFGYMYANPKHKMIFACDGKEFMPITLAGLGSQANPAASCKAIKLAQPFSPSGTYWIDPDGPFGSETAFETWCDQETNGGGWTLAIKGTLNGSYNGSLDKDISAAKGFMRSFNRVSFKDVLVKMGDYKLNKDWAAYHGVGNGNQTLDHRIKNCCSGSYSVDYNTDAPHKVSARSTSLASVSEVEALSLRMSQTSGPNDAMFFVLTRKSRSDCGNYVTPASHRYVTSTCVGAQLGFGVGAYTWSNWTTWTGWQTGCGYAGYWAGATNNCQASGAVFIR